MINIEKLYKPEKVETSIYNFWQENDFFKPKIDKKKKPFVIIMPPPNANASLHIGHAVFITLEDIMIRYHRLKGDPTLWVPGTDHAGIATQVVFERKLKKEGKKRTDFQREEFFKKCYEFTIKNREIIKNQIKKLGASCDWSREHFTLEPEITKSVYFTFGKLLKDGLIYRGKRIINWCPRCKTALSNLEVRHKTIKGKLYYLRYPILDSNNYLIVATTRPETMLGDSAVAVNPNDKRYKDLIKKKVKIKLPLVGRIIPLIVDKRVEIDFGTGAVKITPAHDFADFEIGKEHNLEFIQVIDEQARMTNNVPEKYQGLDRFECREKVLEDLKNKNLIEKIEDYNVPVSVCDRCGEIIEPLISEQWFVKTKKLAESAILAVKEGKIKFIPKHFEKIFFHWLENIQDWCISRQIWWGQRIPIWYCQNKKEKNYFFSIEKPKECPFCKKCKPVQDPDTLDTWFSSGQWPFTVFGWPKKTKDFEYFYPTTVMETGWDILFFWVARMIMLGLYLTKKPPFTYVYLHGLVRDKDRKKMSKSKGNVIDPLGVISLYGADALRMALVFGTGAGRDIIISEEKIIGQRKFTNKIWNAARFLLSNIEEDFNFLKIKESSLVLSKEDKWILTETKKLEDFITEKIEKFQFHIAAEKIYHFFWHSFCDKTIENVKERLKKSNKEDKKAAKWVLCSVFYRLLILLHPFMPFITEKIYQLLPFKRKKALIIEDWPEK